MCVFLPIDASEIALLTGKTLPFYPFFKTPLYRINRFPLYRIRYTAL